MSTAVMVTAGIVGPSAVAGGRGRYSGRHGRRAVIRLFALLLCLAGGVARARPHRQRGGGFVGGLVASAVRAGPCGGDGGGRAVGRVSRRARDLLLPVVFPLVMAFGGVLGILGVPLPGVEIGIAISAVVLGMMVALAARPPLWVAAVLVGAFAIFHGHAHGAELAARRRCARLFGGLRHRDRLPASRRHRLRPAGALAGGTDRGARRRRRDRASPG